MNEQVVLYKREECVVENKRENKHSLEARNWSAGSAGPGGLGVGLGIQSVRIDSKPAESAQIKHEKFTAVSFREIVALGVL